MKKFITTHHRLLFYGLWLLLSLLQAGLTELQDDEAYYWVFSKFLSWGYFDHPPLTALAVKGGYALLQNELGVRLIFVLVNLFTLISIEKLTGKNNRGLFYTIALSLTVFQLAGFMASPDALLIFFTAIFFLQYRNFCKTRSWQDSILFGVIIALLCYSKYQAALVILFTLLSRPQLFKTYHIYLSGIVALLLFTPHLLWQYNHHWISFRYHLFESNVNPYKFSYTLEYIAGQLLLAGPVAGFILFPAAFLYRVKNETEKAMQFCLWGILIFFLLSSFRGKVEANWTSPALIPIFVLSYHFLGEKAKRQQWLRRLLPISILFIGLARCAMVADFLPVRYIRQHFHAWKEWPREMKKITGGLPVVFSNSYQRASKYWFYTGQTCYSQNLYKQRMNNFNIWPVEDSLLGKPVYFLDIYNLQRFRDSLKTPIGNIGYRYDPSFVSFAKVRVVAEKNLYKVNRGQKTQIRISLELTEEYRKFIMGHPLLDSRIRLAVYDRFGWVGDILTPHNLYQAVTGKISYVEVSPDLNPGNYFLRFAVEDGDYNTTHNSDKIKLKIE